MKLANIRVLSDIGGEVKFWRRYGFNWRLQGSRIVWQSGRMLLNPRNWTEMEEWIDARISGASRHGVLAYDLSTPALRAARNLGYVQERFARVENRCFAGLAKAREQLAKTGEVDWQGLAPLTARVLLRQLDTVQLWLRDLRTHGDSGPVAPLDFPRDWEFEDFARWLLVDWWQEHGRERAADEMALMRYWTP